jgi:hypothetical protein
MAYNIHFAIFRDDEFVPQAVEKKTGGQKITSLG